MADVVGANGSNYRLSATLEMNDQMSNKLRGVVSQLRSVDGAISRLDNRGEVMRLSRQLDSLKNLSQQVEQFKQLKKSVSATQQAYNQANATTAQLARQYKSGQSVVAQLTQKHADLQETFTKSQTATSQLKTKLGDLKSEAAKIKGNGATEEYRKLQDQIKATSAELKSSQAMTRSTGAELKTLASGVKQAQRELANIGNAFEQSKNKAAQLKRELQNQQPVLNQMRKNLSEQGFNTRDFVASDRQLRQRIADTSQKLYTEQKIQQLRETLSAAGMKVSNPRPIPVNVNGNATSTLGKIKNQLNSLTQKTWNVAINAKNAVGGKMNDFMNGATMGMGAQFMGTAGLGYGVMDAVSVYKEFEYQMATVKAITGANAEEFKILTDRAKELGATTMFKASEVGKAEEYMGMAGWKTEQINKGLPAVLNLATASGEDLARVSDIVTDSMTAFGLNATDVIKTADGKIVNATDHFSDVMAALATNANTTVGMAGETSKYSAAVVGSLYASQSADDKMRAFEDWASITGIMANAGIKASMSGTAQRSMLTRLAALQQNANAARESLGVDFIYQNDEFDESTGEILHRKGQTRRLRDILGDMRARFQGDFDPDVLLDMTERLEGKEFSKQQRIKLGTMIENVKANGGQMTDADKATITSMLAGQEGMAAWLSVLMASTEDWNKMADAIDNAHGKAEEMSKIKMNTLKGDVDALGAAFEALQLEIFTGQGGSGLRAFVQGVTDDIRYIQTALKDGFDVGDIGGLIARVITQLKDKFLELNGVGSVLAGGALVVGLKKIYDIMSNIKNAAITAKGWWKNAGAQGVGSQRAQGTGLQSGITSSVGSMTVHANSVIINGRVTNQGQGATGQTAGASQNNRASGASTTARVSSAPSTTSRAGGALKTGGGAAILTALFAAADVYSTRSINEEQLSQTNASYEQAKAEYNTIAADPNRSQELPQAAQNLQQASKNLEITKQETIQRNNESLFGAGGAITGAAAGAAIGSIIPGAGTVIGGVAGLVLGAVGASIGANIGADLSKKFDFDVYDSLMGNENESTRKSTPRADWKTDSGVMYSKLSTEDKIRYHQNESATERANRETAEGAIRQSIEQQKHDEKMQKWQSGEFGDSALAKVSKEEIDTKIEERKRVKERSRIQVNQPFAGIDTSVSTKGMAELNGIINASQESASKNFNAEIQKLRNIDLSTILPDFNLSEWFNEKMSAIPDLSTLLPDFNLSEWFNEKISAIPDLSTLLPDFSVLSAPAINAFDSILSSASESWAAIQAEWSQLPAFFSGLWAGAGSAAVTAGSTIASGINSAIGTIQSAWEGLSSWLSSKISALSSMASSAASSVMSFVTGGGGVGHNATGTASWRGGFTEVNELGGEIIDLPNGARIYPHATTMKMLQQDIDNGELNGLGGYFAGTSNLISNQNATQELSVFPQPIQFGEIMSGSVDNSSSTTTNSNTGVTISGNTFNVRKDTDINEIAFKIMELMLDNHANHAGI